MLLAIYDESVRTLAKTLGLVTVSVNYRLAPANPHPAQLDDVTAAFRYFITHATQWGVDPERIAIAGESFFKLAALFSFMCLRVGY